MNEETIKRINELARKSKTIGLTDAEAQEQKELRQEYIAAIKANIKATLDNVSIVNPDGSITDLKDKNK